MTTHKIKSEGTLITFRAYDCEICRACLRDTQWSCFHDVVFYMVLFGGLKKACEMGKKKPAIALIALSTMLPKSEGGMSVLKRSDWPQCPGSHVCTIVAKMEIGHGLKWVIGWRWNQIKTHSSTYFTMGMQASFLGNTTDRRANQTCECAVSSFISRWLSSESIKNNRIKYNIMKITSLCVSERNLQLLLSNLSSKTNIEKFAWLNLANYLFRIKNYLINWGRLQTICCWSPWA